MGPEPYQTPIVALLLTVFNSIVEVFLLCVAGYILAGRGILDKKTQKQLNHLNVSLFTPALLFSKVAFFLSPAKLRELWVVPLFFILVTLVSMLTAFTLGWLFGLKRSQRSFAMAAAMFMNSNSLPIALMQSLVVSVPGLKWGEDDNNNAMVGRALTYLVVYSTLGMVVRWSYGVRLLSQADDEPLPPHAHLPTALDETTPLLGTIDRELEEERELEQQPPSQPSTSAFTFGEVEDEPPAEILSRPTPRRRTTFYKSFPNSPSEAESVLPPCESESESETSRATSTFGGEYEIEEAPRTPLPLHVAPAVPKPPHTFFHHVKHRLRRAIGTVHNFMTVPLWAALASVLVACIRPLQHAIEAHLTPIKGAVAAAGNCSIPLTLVVLGAYFYPSSPPPSDEDIPIDENGTANGTGKMKASQSSDTLVHSVKDFFHLSKQRNSTPVLNKRKEIPLNPGETRTVVIAVLSRMLITPVLLMPLMAFSAKFDWHRVFEDPVFIVSNVLLVSSPPALTLAQITQAASGDAFERLISRTIFWSYCVVTPPATIFYVVVGLLFAAL
ncbi:putative transporter C5D6.04 [Hypsizygus marmoreus]|uniref:Transporter C5D6.04 n=1 Tax=Hypsizygus marmoreus TaxID=39966 RepID=A0A369K5N1_HYPMA|nr:putative transporter C5D6.04 [Hypsizygus marmoreus]